MQAVVERAFPASVTPAFVWARSRCTRFRLPGLDEQGFDSLDYSTQYEFAKRLKKVVRRGFDLKRTLIVDDTPEKVRQNYGNAIYIKPYLGAPDDRELASLAEYLLTLKEVENVRGIEKRHWRDSAQEAS